MRIVSFVSRKGGTAKSTLARHCAVAATLDGQRVAIMDCDQQATLRDWGSERGARPPLVVGETSTARRYVEQALARLEGQGIELVLIDTPGTFEGGYSLNAIAVADYVVVPSRPTQEDTSTFWETEERVKAARKPFGAVVTQAPTTTLRPGNDALAMFRASGVEVCPTVVHLRTIVPDSYAGGSTVFEFERRSDSDERAATELRAVWEWVRSRIEGAGNA